MANELSFRPTTGDIPTQPGVYRFLDANGRVLYVGKAKNLRSRLTSYFAPLASLHNRTRRMVTSANDVTWTVVKTEFEALQLEFTWIKEFDPPFNVQFTDDKSYPYLAITLDDEVPRVVVTRRRNIPGATYFGPFTKTWAIRESLDLLLKPFPVRTCSDSIYARAKKTNRPCLLGDIGRCAAPCVGRVTPAEHVTIAQQLASFMGGDNETFVAHMRDRMVAASAVQDYETAARYRDNLDALTTVAAKSAVVLTEDLDADVFGFARDDLSATVQQFIVRGGRVRGVRAWTVDTELDVTSSDLVDSIIRQAFVSDEIPAPVVILPELPDDAPSLSQWLTERRRDLLGKPRGAAVRLTVAQRGEARRLLDTVVMNAGEQLIQYKNRRLNDFSTRSQALADIQDALGLSGPPLRIECFDISHLQGTEIVASMVVFEDGLPRKAHYRKFALADARDDTDAMAQVLTRRVAYLTHKPVDGEKSSFAYPPGLFIVDGGLPQVNAAQAVLAREGIAIPVVGIAKRLEELWLPGADFPVILPRMSEALFMVQRIRDEAHRFAITFQRQRRKRDIATVLTSVPGLGDKKASALLRHFGSVAQLKAAGVDDLCAVSGITSELARAIVKTLTSTDAPAVG
ncbi:MAG: excinuclease ABC subunit UvrC [Aurantimicrobium sp.]|nr:excinuclease ABC subunit UvrC [Aurantimicrobium sp.]